MRIKTILFGFTSIMLYCCSCKSTQTNTKSTKAILTDTIPDSTRLISYKGDTVGYINYLIDNQLKYVGKPLSELLKDMDLKIYGFSYAPNLNNKYNIYNLTLETKPYGSPARIVNGVNQDIEIGIGWKAPLPLDSIKGIIKENGPPHYTRWSKKAETYFGKQIIGNLWLRGYLKR